MNSILILVTLLCVSVAAHAADSDALQQYLDQLHLKLDHAAQRSNQPASGGSSVVGLRGSKVGESPTKQLYWKGRATDDAVSVDEVRLFRSAVEQARAGQVSEAVTALKAFDLQYPKSALKSDVDETIQRLSAAPPMPAPSGAVKS